MSLSNYIHLKTFLQEDIALKAITKGEYEACTFKACDFSNNDLSGFVFSNCNFIECNLSLAKINKTAFRETHFKNCKLLGLRFDAANPFLFEVNFDDCQLNISSFFKMDLTRCRFSGCVFKETDFTESNVTGCVFTNCDFDRALFENTKLEKADLSTSFNYVLDPENNRIKGAKFSLNGVGGLLQKYGIRILNA